MSTTRPEKRDESAERIRAAVLARKYGAEQGQRFILPWRIHANEDHENSRDL